MPAYTSYRIYRHSGIIKELVTMYQYLRLGPRPHPRLALAVYSVYTLLVVL